MNGKELLDDIEKREAHHKAELVEIEQEKKKVLLSLQEKAAIKTMSSVFKFRDNFRKKVLKDFEAVNECLAELEELNPGYLHFLETGTWGSRGEPGEVKYLVGYLFGSAWKKDSDLWRVLSQIADTIDIPGNPFAGGE